MNDPCRNCGHRLPDDASFCPACGQKVAGLPTVRELFGQFVDDVFSVDSKFARTYAVLVVRPGRLTRDYLEGRRQRYVRPLRLYLVNSLVFFLIASWSGVETVKIGSVGNGAATDGGVDVAGALENASFDDEVRIRLRDTLSEAGADSTWIRALAADDSTAGWFESARDVPWIGDRLVAQGRRLDHMSGDRLLHELNANLLRNLPKAVFAMVPVFAGVLALVYRRRRRRYVEHFVFALHGHALAFLVFTVVALVDRGPVEAALLIAFAVHAVLSLRAVYEQGWFKSVVKAGLIMSSYTVCLLVALFGAGVVTLLTL